MATTFTPSQVFTLLRTRDGSVLDTGAPELATLPILGEYHPGSTYTVTSTNEAGVTVAVAAGLATIKE